MLSFLLPVYIIHSCLYYCSAILPVAYKMQNFPVTDKLLYW